MTVSSGGASAARSAGSSPSARWQVAEANRSSSLRGATVSVSSSINMRLLSCARISVSPSPRAAELTWGL
eukprot:scaffold33330_cov66-Phaeocystis_antarctica.AAC.3